MSSDGYRKKVNYVAIKNDKKDLVKFVAAFKKI